MTDKLKNQRYYAKAIISYDPPKDHIYRKAKEVFGASFKKGTVITIGEIIYSCKPMPDDLLAHEITHVKQQLEMGKFKWWKQYFKEPNFRLEQEIEAYHNQYEHIKKFSKDRTKHFGVLHNSAKTLSSSLYGNIISYADAVKEIKKEL